jgi:uncharacterized DUF497 family protein
MKIDGFDWDSGNLMKNEAKHGLTHLMIEAFFKGALYVAPDPKHSSREDRFLAIGRSPEGRPMIVAFTLRTREGRVLIRPISARYMHVKEARKYDETFAKAKE